MFVMICIIIFNISIYLLALLVIKFPSRKKSGNTIKAMLNKNKIPDPTSLLITMLIQKLIMVKLPEGYEKKLYQTIRYEEPSSKTVFEIHISTDPKLKILGLTINNREIELSNSDIKNLTKSMNDMFLRKKYEVDNEEVTDIMNIIEKMNSVPIDPPQTNELTDPRIESIRNEF